MMKRSSGAFLLLILLCGSAQAGLLAYVTKPDPSYTWSVLNPGPNDASLQYAELRMVSQTWRDTPWQHRLILVRPADIKEASHALLIIGGGSWHAGLEKERISPGSQE